jgi:hypothetical protein
MTCYCETHTVHYEGMECPFCFKDYTGSFPSTTINVGDGEASITFHDPVNHPKHYTSHPSGVECIQITEHLNFCLGNAVKYIWRAGEKDQAKEIEDLEKASWYLLREIERRKTSGN